MLRDGTGFKKVIICCGKVDLRRGIDGLVAYVRLNYGLNPIEKGTLFLFEGDGMLLLYKRLAEGNRFHWPRTPKEAREIDADMYRSLMAGNLLVGTIREVYPQREQ